MCAVAVVLAMCVVVLGLADVAVGVPKAAGQAMCVVVVVLALGLVVAGLRSNITT